MKHLLLCLALAAVPANAGTVLYFDDFSGGVADKLHGTTPGTTTGSNTWIAHEKWKADGSIAQESGTAADQNAFLAFTPTSGFIYTLSATLAKPTNTGGGSWAGIGFTNDTLGTAAGNNSQSFFGGTNAATAWMLYRGQTNDIAAFAGPGTANGSGNVAGGPYTGTQTLTVVLDTTATQWKAEWFVGATSVHTFTYETNPTISYVGLGRENSSGADFASFSLTVAPEHSAAPQLPLAITKNPDTPGTFDFEWDSQPGKLYDLLTSTDLADPISEWPIYDDGVAVYEAIPSAGETTTLTAVPSTDPRRFFAIREGRRAATAAAFLR